MGWTDDSETEEVEETEVQSEEEVESSNPSPGVENDETEDVDGDTMTETDQEVDLSQLAPSAMGVDEAAEQEHTFKIMCWADPGCGKTHMGYTMPEPICIIDTENKADDLASKFEDKDVFIWQPSGFDEAVDFRDEALNLLSEYKSQTGKNGTLMVDSMADMWEWSQYKFIDEWYPNTPPDKVNLELQDWPKIKDYHNKEFRKPMEDCNFNVYWTSTRKDDVGAAIENDLDQTPDKPGGESNNSYKVNSIIRLYLNSNGVPVGDLQKSGIVRFKYVGLTRPTFPKHKEIVEELEEIEANGAQTVQEVENQFSLDYDISFTEANTMRFIQ